MMSQFELDERTRAVLDRVWYSPATLSVYDMPPDLAVDGWLDKLI
jgi:hypothetical protein